MTHSHKHHSPGFLALVDDAKTRVKQITIEHLPSLQEHILIDVREDHEFHEAHAAGAMHLGKGIIERDIEAAVPDKNATIVLYCGGGYRSALAADALMKMGYSNPVSLDGGWRAWQEAKLPVEKGS